MYGWMLPKLSQMLQISHQNTLWSVLKSWTCFVIVRIRQKEAQKFFVGKIVFQNCHQKTFSEEKYSIQ